jgi:hypothetical protein
MILILFYWPIVRRCSGAWGEKGISSRRASFDSPTSRKKGDKFIYWESPGTQASMSRQGFPE